MKFLKHDKRGEANVKGVIGVFIAILVGLTLLPTILTSVGTVKNDTGTLGTGGVTMIGLVPIFFALSLGIIAIMYVYREVQG